MPQTTILITGANSGLGFSTCCRLIDEFLSVRPASHTLRLLFTVRSPSKATETLARLRAHLDRTIAAVYGSAPKTASIRDLQRARVDVRAELADLCDLRSVKRLARRLREEKVRVDCLVCNAGIGGWKGMDWLAVPGAVLGGYFEAMTFPTFKIGHVGRLVPQEEKVVEKERGLRLGETFAANVFGHYMLGCWLGECLARKEGDGAARIIWVSSIEAFDKYLDLEDMQALKVSHSYESSKRLTDLLALGSELPSTSRYVEAYLSDGRGGVKNSPTFKDTPEGVVVDTDKVIRPKMYLSHPGVCVTSISGIHWILNYFFIASLYVARWLGSPWHPISSYLGAVPTVWLALASTDVLEKLEGEEGKAKWGAATDRIGNERVVRTEVDGWGYGGQPGETADGIWRLEARKGTNKVVTKEERGDFEVRATKVWQEMETLRRQWEGILEDD